MIRVRRAIRELLGRFDGQLLALETGTIRSYTEKHESTRHIAEALGDRGRLISVDLSAEAIRVSQDICRHLHNIEWVEQDSVSYLSTLEGQRLHFALLDSVNDEDVIFEEFRQVVPRMVEGGIVMVDDAGIRSALRGIDHRSAAVKGRKVWRFLDSCNADCDVVRTPRGHGTQLRVRLGGTNAVRIREALHIGNGTTATVPFQLGDEPTGDAAPCT